MKIASVAELKARLSEYLAAARHPHWAELLRVGLMRAPAGKLPADFRKLQRAQDPQGSVADAWRAEREEHW